MSQEWLPICDRVNGYPTPAEHGHLHGHDDAYDELLAAHASGRLHHAWLITGPRGIGKATLAYRAAGALLANSEEASSSVEAVGRRIASRAHPNLLVIDRPWDEKKKVHASVIPVSEVRRTQSFFGMTGIAKVPRICIVDAAEDMNASAANALLKMLEEPPSNSIFLIVTHAAGRLLPTIRSRCRNLRLNPVSDDEVRQVVLHLTGQTPDDVAQARGRPRRALQLIDATSPGLTRDFFSAARTTTWDVAYRTADRLAGRSADYEFTQFVDLLKERVWDEMKLTASNDGKATFAWSEAWREAMERIDEADTFNLDRSQLVLDLFATLVKAHQASPRPPQPVA